MMGERRREQVRRECVEERGRQGGMEGESE